MSTEAPDLSKAATLNIDVDHEKIKMLVAELAQFADGKDVANIELIFALNELAGRIIVQSCGGHPLHAASLKHHVQKHLDNVVRVGFQATYIGGASGETPRIVTTH